MAHYKFIHKDELIDDDRRTLLDMGFSRGPPLVSDSTSALSTGPNKVQSRNTTPIRGQAITQPLPFRPNIPSLFATAEWDLDHRKKERNPLQEGM